MYMYTYIQHRHTHMYTCVHSFTYHAQYYNEGPYISRGVMHPFAASLTMATHPGGVPLHLAIIPTLRWTSPLVGDVICVIRCPLARHLCYPLPIDTSSVLSVAQGLSNHLTCIDTLILIVSSHRPPLPHPRVCRRGWSSCWTCRPWMPRRVTGRRTALGSLPVTR